jgi:hypothetical protein
MSGRVVRCFSQQQCCVGFLMPSWALPVDDAEPEQESARFFSNAAEAKSRKALVEAVFSTTMLCITNHKRGGF